MNDQNANRLNIDGMKLEYCRFVPYEAAGARPPTLVLLHEGLGCVAMWKDWPQHLADATGCPVFAYSRAGYGASDPVHLPRPLRYMHHEGHDVVPRVLDEAGINDAILVGHSDGGSIAIVTAGGEQDPRVKALVLMAAHVFNEQVCVDSIRRARDAYENGQLRQGLHKYHGDNVDIAFKGWNGAWLDPEFWHWNLEQYLPGIRVPVLIMQGQDDEYGTAAQVEAIKTQVSGDTRVQWLNDCGHAPHREQPVAAVAAIVDFCKAFGFAEGPNRPNFLPGQGAIRNEG